MVAETFVVTPVLVDTRSIAHLLLSQIPVDSCRPVPYFSDISYICVLILTTAAAGKCTSKSTMKQAYSSFSPYPAPCYYAYVYLLVKKKKLLRTTRKLCLLYFNKLFLLADWSLYLGVEIVKTVHRLCYFLLKFRAYDCRKSYCRKRNYLHEI